MTKICAACSVLVNPRAKCRACRQVNRRKRRQKSKAVERAKRVALAIKAKAKPCCDCGQKYPHYVMDFDHRVGVVKVAGISDMVFRDRSAGKIKAEIAKCDVVCANCHRERTHQRRILD